MTTATKIYEAINAIMSAIEPIAKNKVNPQQNYKFRGVDDVYAVLSPMLTANKVVIIPNVTRHSLEQFTTSKGGVIFRAIVDVEYTIASAEDGSIIKVVVTGEGMDSGDKATPKALSGAYKYMAFQLFCIPVDTGDDAEKEDHSIKSTATQSAPQTQTAGASPDKWLNKFSDKQGTISREWKNVVDAITMKTVVSVSDIAKIYKINKELRAELQQLIDDAE